MISWCELIRVGNYCTRCLMGAACYWRVRAVFYGKNILYILEKKRNEMKLIKRSRRIRKENTKMYTISVVHTLVFTESLCLGHCTGLDPERTSLTQVKISVFFFYYTRRKWIDLNQYIIGIQCNLYPLQSLIFSVNVTYSYKNFTYTSSVLIIYEVKSYFT